jgi:adenine phosphoribosyltransferase
VHDDLLATGGTARGVCDLVAGLGAEVAGCAFLIELSFLGGRQRLQACPVHAVLEYAS